MSDIRLRTELATDASTSSPSTIAVLALSGELDLATADDVTSLGLAAMRQDGVRELVVDLGAVTFMDSTALSALIELRNDALDRNLSLRLRDLSPRLRRLFSVTGLHDAFTID